MWRTSAGERVLAGPEWELVRSAVNAVADSRRTHPADDDVAWGVAVFDNLERNQQVALLALVAQALFDPAVPSPPLTAVNEAAVATLFSAIEVCIDFELAAEAEQLSQHDPFCWRRMIRACFDERDFTEAELTLEPLESDNREEWAELIWILADGVLWDDDWETEELILDADPETARARKQRWGIAEDYYTAIAPDPTPAELERAWETLRSLR